MNASCQTPYIVVYVGKSTNPVTAMQGNKPFDLSHRAKDDNLILNLHPEATGRDGVIFDEKHKTLQLTVRFDQVATDIWIPAASVIYLYDKNTGDIQYQVTQSGDIWINPELIKESPELEKYRLSQSSQQVIPLHFIAKVAEYMSTQYDAPIIVKTRSGLYGTLSTSDIRVKRVDGALMYEVDLFGEEFGFSVTADNPHPCTLVCISDADNKSEQIISAFSEPNENGEVAFHTSSEGIVIRDHGLHEFLVKDKSSSEPAPGSVDAPRQDVVDFPNNGQEDRINDTPVDEVEAIAEKSNGRVVVARFGKQ